MEPNIRIIYGGGYITETMECQLIEKLHPGLHQHSYVN